MNRIVTQAPFIDAKALTRQEREKVHSPDGITLGGQIHFPFQLEMTLIGNRSGLIGPPHIIEIEELIGVFRDEILQHRHKLIDIREESVS